MLFISLYDWGISIGLWGGLERSIQEEVSKGFSTKAGEVTYLLCSTTLVTPSKSPGIGTLACLESR